MHLRERHLTDEQLSMLMDGRLDAKAQQRAETHLRTCPACRQAYEELRQTVALLRATPRVAVPRAFTLSEADVGRVPRRRHTTSWTRWATVLVGLMLVAVLGLDVMLRALTVSAPPQREWGALSERRATPEMALQGPAEAPPMVSKQEVKGRATPLARGVAPVAATPPPKIEEGAVPTPPAPSLVPTLASTLPSAPSETDILASDGFVLGVLRAVEIGLAALFIFLVILLRLRG